MNTQHSPISHETNNSWRKCDRPLSSLFTRGEFLVSLHFDKMESGKYIIYGSLVKLKFDQCHAYWYINIDNIISQQLWETNYDRVCLIVCVKLWCMHAQVNYWPLCCTMGDEFVTVICEVCRSNNICDQMTFYIHYFNMH